MVRDEAGVISGDVEGFMQMIVVDLVPHAFLPAVNHDVRNPVRGLIVQTESGSGIGVGILAYHAERDSDLGQPPTVRNVEIGFVVRGFYRLNPTKFLGGTVPARARSRPVSARKRPSAPALLSLIKSLRVKGVGFGFIGQKIYSIISTAVPLNS